MPLATQSLTLANGLTVVLQHAPRLKRCAAALRVAAGSHDVPLAWPGLAHFLEHLFFLGTERFAGSDGLMAFVQRHGGQVNARTTERHTDFFFELPKTSFEPALERLCDMLAAPRLDVADQRREREVLHAEFIAWSQDAAARRQVSLLNGLGPTHPLRGFHAGNRYSLTVPNPAFQLELGTFYQRFYQAGQMTLSLTGPQPFSELKRLAETWGGAFALGQHQRQAAPPALFDHSPPLYQLNDGNRLDLLLGLEHLPAQVSQALAFILGELNSAYPGGFFAEAQSRGWLSAYKAQALYRHGGQALVQMEFELTAAGKSAPDAILATLFDWLRFFAAQLPGSASLEQFTRLQQSQRDSSGALDLARLALETDQLPADAETVQQVLGQWLAAAADFPRQTAIDWQLPPANPYLQPYTPSRSGLARELSNAPAERVAAGDEELAGKPAPTGDRTYALQISDALAVDSGEAALWLRWQFAQADKPLLRMLTTRLTPLIGQARQAGVELELSSIGNSWMLRLHGLAPPLDAVAQDAIGLIATPDESTWALYSPEDRQPVPIPIRHLLGALPDVLVGVNPSTANEPRRAWAQLWPAARWDGLAVGSITGLAALADLIPGQPSTIQPQPLPVTAGVRWHNLGTDDPQSAVLLFCPAPSNAYDDQCAWRLLAQVGQAPFYQRLRVELQLGYAVFSGIRQIAGQTGLVFGVQSPTLSHAEIFTHLQAFISGLVLRVAQLDQVTLTEYGRLLATQLQLSALETPQLADWLWQARLAGHPLDTDKPLAHAIAGVSVARLSRAAEQLNAASAGWVCLRNRSTPGVSHASLPQR